jgi:hypothetical protein
MHQKRSRASAESSRPAERLAGGAGGQSFVLFAFLSASVAVLQLLAASNQVYSLSLISEKCDPNKVGPDETTVKGGWQAEMFNGLSFRACGKSMNKRPPRRHLGNMATVTSRPLADVTSREWNTLISCCAEPVWPCMVLVRAVPCGVLQLCGLSATTIPIRHLLPNPVAALRLGCGSI